MLKPKKGTTGRLQVRVYHETIPTTRSVHSLVCEAFYGPAPKHKPWALHRNGDHLDNRPENLYWGTPKENSQDAKRHGKNFEANKAHCIHGHEYDEWNTYIRPDGGGRQCKACVQRRAKEQSARLRLQRSLDAMKEEDANE